MQHGAQREIYWTSHGKHCARSTFKLLFQQTATAPTSVLANSTLRQNRKCSRRVGLNVQPTGGHGADGANTAGVPRRNENLNAIGLRLDT
jgi:hypothetical protein